MNNDKPQSKPKLVSTLTQVGNRELQHLHKVILIIFLSSFVTFIVFSMGGTKSAWPQLYFTIIILAAHFWTIKGGLIVAFILGLIAGPFMPLDVSQGIMQTPENWIIRLISFMMVGAFVGYILQRNERVNNQIREKDFIDEFTGLYNINKMYSDLNKLIDNDEEFCLVFFNIKNLDEISKYVNHKLTKDMTQYCISSIKSLFNGSVLYSSNYNEYLLILKDCNKDNCDINEMSSKDLETFFDSVEIEDYFFDLIVKIGVAFSEGNGSSALELNRKVRVAASQNESFESGIYVYDPLFDENKRVFHEISESLRDGLKNDEFYAVYQPIIDLNNSTIASIEVLARWNRGERSHIGPNTFIKIAEEIGLIQKVTKNIIIRATNQLIHWEKIGISIQHSFNITGNELIDESFVGWVKDFLDSKNIDRTKLGIEITERVLAFDGNKLNGVLSYLHKQGYCISIDDFGMGHNTLKGLIDIDADIIKIDKYFINRLNEKHTKNLIRHLIQLVHEMGLLVVAEGVETKEQFLTLKQLGCDMIQGYYFSKPLLPNDFVEYYKSFDMSKYL